MLWKSRVKDIKVILGIKTNKELELTLGLGNGYFYDLIRGKIKKPSKLITSLFDKFKINPTWVSTGQGAIYADNQDIGTEVSTNEWKIPVLSQRVSAGPGQEWQKDDEIESYITPLELIPGLASINPRAVHIRGNSLHGLGIHDGDVAIFDPRQDMVTKDGVYVFALDSEIFIKYCVFDPFDRTITAWSVEMDGNKKKVVTIETKNELMMERFRLFGRVVVIMRDYDFEEHHI